MPYKKLIFFIAAFVSTTLLAACSEPRSTTWSNQEILFQVSTLSALQAGIYDGQMTIGELKQYGDFGVGTFHALDGEMVVVEGQVYQVKADGVAYLAADDVQTPFAAVTFFEADQAFTVTESLDCSQLQAHLDTLLPTLNAPYAIKVSGTFATLRVRAPHRESQPYPPLAEALANQALFESEQTTGDMVGFRLPDYMAGLNAAGYHFHFISEDRQTGGHVLDCQTDNLAVEIDAIDQFRLDGLQADPSQQANFEN